MLYNYCNSLTIYTKSFGLKIIRRVGVFTVFAFSALIFRSQSLDELGAMLVKFFTGFGFGNDYFNVSFANLGMDIFELLQVIISITAMALLVNFVDFESENDETRLLNTMQEKSLYAQRVSVYGYAIFAIAFCWLALLANQDVSSFAYFQF